MSTCCNSATDVQLTLVLECRCHGFKLFPIGSENKFYSFEEFVKVEHNYAVQKTEHKCWAMKQLFDTEISSLTLTPLWTFQLEIIEICKNL